MDKFPSWRYGPNGQACIVNSEDETPSGWHDHPSKVEGSPDPNAGAQTAVQSANGSVSEAQAAQTTEATSQTITDPAKAATSGVGGDGRTPATGDTASQPGASPSGNTAEVDAHGHPYDANLHAATRSKTKEGLWRLKVGGKRPAPLAGYPKPAVPLDL